MPFNLLSSKEITDPDGTRSSSYFEDFENLATFLAKKIYGKTRECTMLRSKIL